MGVAAWRPDFYFGVAFSADPNDPGTVPIWSDLTARLRTANSVTRGRQYELDQNLAAQASVTLDDPDEYLNPANTSSPYYPNVVPFRQCIWQGVWPNPCSGNLLNTGVGANPQLGTTSSGYDPSFESYATSATVPWITAVGSTTPTVTTSNPQQGSKDLTWTVAGTSTPQGVSWNVPCIPGRQYTSSAYVRQTSASTQLLTVGGLTALDRFNRTGALNSSTADTGQTWSFSGGVTGDYTTTAGAAGTSTGTMAISNSSTNVNRFAVLSTSAQDFDFRMPVTIPVVATGAAIVVRLVGRYASATTQYQFGLTCNTTGLVDVKIWSNVSGSLTQLAATTGALTYSAGTTIWIRAQGIGPSLRCKAWLDGTAESSAFTTSVTDASITAAGNIGVLNTLATGNTNGTTVITHGPMAVTSYSAAGGTTSTTGSYVRLTATFTATQPVHTVQVATNGTAVAGTINLDAVQHEQAASVSAFTTTGSVIYGIMRGYVERWPSAWDHGGFRGRCEAILVDALAPLNRIPLSSEYRLSLLAKQPDYWWPLDEPSTTTKFLEKSGHNASPLTKTDGPFGAGPTFTPGTAMNVAGDPGAAGLATDQPTTGFLNLPVSVAATDLNAVNQPVAVGSAGSTYGLTVSAWITHGTVPATSAGRIFLLISSPLSSVLYQVIWQIDGLFSTKLDFSGVTVTDAWADGKPHLYVHTMTVGGGNTTDTIWVDGVQAGTNTYASSTIPLGTVAQIGGAINPGVGNGNYHTTAAGPNLGSYSHFAVWNRVLSNAEIADLWAAGKGYTGETSGARITRYLGYGWLGPTSIDTGQSVMGVSGLTASSSAASATSTLTGCQDTTTSEYGDFWVDSYGTVTFAARTRRYNVLTSQYVFGENVAGGEVPYEEGIGFGFDPTQIYNVVEVDNLGGVVAVAPDTASQKRNFLAGYQTSVNVSDNEAIDHANWILSTHKNPAQRVEAITFEPGSKGATHWPVVLGTEIGQRDTVKRRASAANSGTGLTMSGDFFVEQINHSGIDMEAGTWQTTLLLSPAFRAQVWILGDATYGQLGITTTLAF